MNKKLIISLVLIIFLTIGIAIFFVFQSVFQVMSGVTDNALELTKTATETQNIQTDMVNSTFQSVFQVFQGDQFKYSMIALFVVPFILMFVIFGVVIKSVLGAVGGLSGKGEKYKKMIGNSAKGTAKIVDMQYSRMRINKKPLIDITVEFQGQLRKMPSLPSDVLFKYRVGDTVTVLYHQDEIIIEDIAKNFGSYF